MIRIDITDKRSISEQIVASVTDLVSKGIYTPGMQVPSVRALATELSINPNTAQKAYSELERKKIIIPVKGKGSIITPDLEPLRELQQAELNQQVILTVKAAKIADVALNDLIDRITANYKTNNGEEER